MTVRIGWDEYEVALLIDACNRIRDNKIDKAECVPVSYTHLTLPTNSRV